MVVWWWLLCNTAEPDESNYVELLRIGVFFVGSHPHRRGERKDPTLVFLVETKARVNRMKGILNKLDYTHGIIVPSDGWSGGLALLWKEGTDIRFKSFSNLHIDMVVHDMLSSDPWHATGFYEQPNSGKRDIS